MVLWDYGEAPPKSHRLVMLQPPPPIRPIHPIHPSHFQRRPLTPKSRSNSARSSPLPASPCLAAVPHPRLRPSPASCVLRTASCVVHSARLGPHPRRKIRLTAATLLFRPSPLEPQQNSHVLSASELGSRPLNAMLGNPSTDD
ncbi:hypothetical protein BS50DRAFT_231125 [Corynespora cassiicola Philippines]|uniref:Uncharacterized protein n=1 Tax=Corynespora cassiicola Philippines TaxID=1448308 RepID=A0A2T2N320_CORCC|nr:hypothetical protein BS50DRAFT_231125 [Corynespora cassiicola Philippines]